MHAIADLSERYVLPPDAPLVRNLAALWTLDPNLAAQIETIDDADAYPLEPSRSGPMTLSVPTADGRKVYLHSRYHPVDEAKKTTDPIDCTKKNVFYLHGLGIGYILEQVFSRTGKDALCCVFEPDVKVIRAFLESRDVTGMLESGRVLFFPSLDKADLYLRLMPHTAVVSLGTESISHTASEQLHPAFHDQIKIWLDEFASFVRTSMNTLVLNGKVTAENVTRNIARYLNTADAAHLENKHKGKPAVIVSAGPSLRKNRHLLKELSEKAVVIAVQTTLQPLIEMGIEPDYVTSLDYHEICSRFYEKLPPKLRTHLVAEVKATQRIYELFPGDVTIVGNDFAEKLVRELNPNKKKLPAGSTVAHLAFYTAELLGCDPIIFVGQDLGFSDGLCYTPGTSYEDVWRPELGRFCTVEMKQWEQIVRDRPILRKIPDVFGRPMYTEERLFTYLQQFERDFLRSDRTIIDATEGGAAKRGTVTKSLREAIDELKSLSLNRDAGVSPVPKRFTTTQIRESLATRLAEAKEIEKIAIETRPLLEEIRDHLTDQPRVNKAIAKIDAIRTRIQAVGATYDLVIQLTQATEMQRFEADRNISAQALEATEKQKRQVERDLANVNAVAEAAIEFQKLLTDVSSTLPEEK